MRASRLLSIQMLLESRGRLSATELASTLEVSVRTVHRDVMELSAAGVPVYAERGRNGGFQLLPGWRASLTGLTPAEAQAVFLGGVHAAAEDLGLAADVRSAQLKLLLAMPQDWRGSAQRVSARFHLDPLDWYREAQPATCLPLVARAVWEQRQLRFGYDSWVRSGQQTVHPLGLVLKAGVWYLVAQREGKVRTFRVPGIVAPEVLASRSARPRGFDLARYWAESVRRFEQDLYTGRASIAATARGLADLRRQSAAVAKAVRAAAPPPEGQRVRLEIPTESVPQAAGQLMRLAPEVEVLGPKRLRDEIVARLRAAAACYAAG